MGEDEHLEAAWEDTIAEVAAFDDAYWDLRYDNDEFDNEWDESNE